MDDSEERRNSNGVDSEILEKRDPEYKNLLMGLGGFMFLVGVGLFIGGFSGIVAGVDIKIRSKREPGIGYIIMLVLSIIVMVAGGVCFFCGCGTINYKKKEKSAQKAKDVCKTYSSSPEQMFETSAKKQRHSNGQVTYSVTYTYRGPPPTLVDGKPSYPPPPRKARTTVCVKRSTSAGDVGKPIFITTASKQGCAPPRQIMAVPYECKNGTALLALPPSQKLYIARRI